MTNPRPAPAGTQGSLGTGGISTGRLSTARQAVTALQEVQRPGRGEGLRLSEKTLIGEQLTGVACEDELQAIAVLDPRQPQATTPELI